ncbi:uncharacterized protein BCR38DRAFT_337311 [Pseudomassariella vexata]|uniref:Helicase-like protein n=1 Tax=Pseudomassariella vexata TaxID=1141098 RepID=A0A1Y2E736_9PEZI|nr:uncharacterized protein BCR38DRAFT_337311 [Pseudomassariella vexata]ORY67361.1 hypothetical protein BCR38DRAFT_337311 [Pseudomassariella vexata]
MANLSETDVEKLFSGAPQYFARSQGYGTGAPLPSVAFPWDEELTIRDLTDHVQIEDDAWGCVTACPRIIMRDPLSPGPWSAKRRAHFNTKCRERPNMLSMQGLEKGTIGYQAALELSVADALQDEQYGFDSLGTKSHVIIEFRQKLITTKDGLRHLDEAAIMEQLLKCEERYEADRLIQRSGVHDMYNELFLKVLHPPTKAIDRNDPYSLSVQIYALVKVLAASNAWYDFSHVEWRIRLGQMLWGFPLDDELEDGSSIKEGMDAQDRTEERYWLLLQILLACELLIRLDMITEGDEIGGQNLRASEVHRFEKEANTSVRWSLLLARSWLENIYISKTEAPPSGASTPKGWLTTLTSKMSLKHESIPGSLFTDSQHRHQGHSEYLYAIQGKYNQRQVFGLTQFARKLRWPEIESYITRLSINTPAMAQATPINSPLPTSDTSRSSYFGGDRKSADLRRMPSRRRKVEAALHPSGWLSKSYVSGLVLPGEALSHFLMSTLLENDQQAMAKLGPMANLCGGFVYSRKSFWSTACIVGRVLAAGRGSAESMGWISSDITPRELGEGWLEVDVKDIPDDVAHTGKKARLWGKVAIERESDVLGDADPSNVLPADFVLPHENSYSNPPPSNIRIEFQHLDLSTPLGSIHSTPTDEKESPVTEDSLLSEIPTYPASMAFTMTHDGIEQEQELSFALSTDVYFVTAHPCVPSSHVKFLKSASSPTIQHIDLGGQDWSGKTSSSAHITGKHPSRIFESSHPLHKYYTYTAVHISELLSKPTATLDDLLEQVPSGSRSNNSSSSTIPRQSRALVIDCITGFAPPRTPDLPSLSRMSSISSSFGLEPPPVPIVQMPTPPGGPERRPSTAASIGSIVSTGSRVSRIDPPSPESKMRLGTRKRQFGSDLEMLVRALCAERGWNALVSRRRRGCLACAIREAGALGWKVIIRVE